MSTQLNGDSCQCQVRQCLLCEAKLYRGLTPEQVCGIRGLLVQDEYQPHEVLFREGDPSTYLLVLRQGLLKLTSLGRDGREQIIGLAAPRRLLGLQSLHSKSYCFTAETLSPVSVCKLRRDDMLLVLEQNPTVSLQLIDLLNRELTEAQALIRVLGQKTAEERVAWFLLTLANADAEPFEMNPLWLSRQEIAELLGLTIETVSRLISEFRRAGLIDTPRGGVRILDLPHLQVRANFSGFADAAFSHRLTAG
jgi:CRP/FNR family transcriptional regulator